MRRKLPAPLLALFLMRLRAVSTTPVSPPPLGTSPRWTPLSRTDSPTFTATSPWETGAFWLASWGEQEWSEGS